MRIKELIRTLSLFPENMEVMVQTCQGDLMQPLSLYNMWASEAFIDEKFKSLEPARLVITSLVTSDKEKIPAATTYSNPRSGVLVKYEPAALVEEQ